VLVFSPLVNPVVTRQFLSPALIALAIGLTFVPLADSYFTTTLAVGLVAASAGILSPIVTYWVSVSANEMQGKELGRATAAASLGQAVGSATAGVLFDVSIVPGAPFFFAAVIILAGLFGSSGLSKLLAPLRREPRPT
jgi:predicted MFS family arabinose efflux permease